MADFNVCPGISKWPQRASPSCYTRFVALSPAVDTRVDESMVRTEARTRILMLIMLSVKHNGLRIHFLGIYNGMLTHLLSPPPTPSYKYITYLEYAEVTAVRLQGSEGDPGKRQRQWWWWNKFVNAQLK